MRTWIAILLLVGLLAPGPLLAPAPASGQAVGDIVAGERLAREVCAACHAVEKGDTLVSFEGAPPFQRVANDPSASEVGLRVFLRTPHEKMPDLILTPQQTDDIVTYILSLRDRVD
ncbi:MAG: c-type cytochrome [Kiloniellales bacterium]|nr:c-type cytochrome [Kiloniellales bacterium]